VSDLPPPPHEESGAELLDQVIRGERFMWLPPGGFAYACLIPCLCPAAVSISWMIVASVSSLGEPGAQLEPYLWMMGLALALVSVATVPHVLVLRGYVAGRLYLIRYVRLLSMLVALLAVGVWLGWVEGRPAFAAPAGLVALAVANALVSSRAYLTVTSFFATKRQYRLAARAREREAGALLAKGKSRQARGQRK
jgi:hypothetical protein